MEDSHKSRINQLNSEKNRIEEEINQIQSDCSHPNKTLKQKKQEVKWECSDCGAFLAYPSKQELEEYLKK